MFGFRRKSAIETPALAGRQAVVAETRAAAAGDQEFQAMIAAADQARYRGEFEAAAAAYRQAVGRFPLHGGCWALLGHTRRELADWTGAEIAYRTAMALGEREVSAPLAIVVARGGGTHLRRWSETVAAYWDQPDTDLFATPVTFDDAADAIELLCDRGDRDPVEIRDLLAACASRRELLERLLAGDEFRNYHRDLLRYIAETGWRG